MADGEFIEVLSPSALSDLNSLNAALVKTVSSVREINTLMGTIRTPSGSDRATSDLNNRLLQQEKLYAQVQIQIQKYNQSIAQTKIKEEQLAQSIMRTEAMTNKQTQATERLSRAYVQLNNRRTEASNKLRDLIASEAASSAEIRKAQKEFDLLDAKVKKADRAVGDFSKNVGNYKSVFSGFTNVLAAFGIGTGVQLFADLTRSIFQTTKEIQSLDLALKTVSETQQQFAANQSFLNEIADKYGIEIQGLTKNFTEFWVASADKLAESEIKEIFESISKSAGVLGLSVQKQDQAFLALQQMMSKGTVQAEELKRQLGDALPGAIKAATAAYQALHPELEVTEKFFLEQMKAGKVLSAELLPELARQFEKLYGIEAIQRVDTLAASQARLTNEWVEFVRSLNSTPTGGISKFFKFFIDAANGALMILTRLNDSWDEIFEKAEERGAAEGKSIFENLMGGKKGEEAARQAESNMRIARNSMKTTVDQIEALQKQLKQTTFMGSFFGQSPTQLNAQIEALKVQKAQYVSLYNLSKDFLALETKPTQGVTPVGKTEAQLKKEEAERNRLLNAQKEALKVRYEGELKFLKEKEEIAKTDMENDRFDVASKIKLSQELADARIAIIRKEEEKRMAILGIDAKQNKLINLKQAQADSEHAIHEAQEKENQDHFQRTGKFYKDFFKSQSEILKAETEAFKKNVTDKHKLTAEQEEALKKHLDKLKQLLDDYKSTMGGFIQDFAGGTGFTKTFEFLTPDETGLNFFQKIEALQLESTQKFAAYFNAISEMGQEAFNFLSQLAVDNSEAQLEALERDRDIALKFAGDNKAAQEKIEREFQEKKRQIELENFKTKQQLGIANVIMDTAQAIVSALATIPPPANFVVAGLVAAIGAAQTAIIAAQKPPKFAKGTDNAPQGFAWTDEAGSELHTDKYGRIKDFGSNKGARLKYLEKGDKIYNAYQTKKLMKQNDFDTSLSNLISSNGINSTLVIKNGITAPEMRNIMEETIANQPKIINRWDNDGFSSSVSRNGNVTKRAENRGSGVGISV